MNVTELTETEFKSTFSEKMNNVTNTVDAIVDIWKYVNLLDKPKYLLNDYIIGKRLVEEVYRNSEETYDQILIPTIRENNFLIIVVDIIQKNIYGHYLLNLNKEYGIEEN